MENYSTSKPLKISPEKSQILSCDTVVVANERYIRRPNACGLYTPALGIAGTGKLEPGKCPSTSLSLQGDNRLLRK